MATRATRRPGQKGTRKHLQQYGDRLLFVRCRYDPQTHTRLTTVELIVDERPAPPLPARKGQAPAPAPQSARPPPRAPAADRSGAPALATVRIGAGEKALRDKVRAAGGYWDPRRGLWVLPSDQVQLLGLEPRVVPRTQDAGGI